MQMFFDMKEVHSLPGFFEPGVCQVPNPDRSVGDNEHILGGKQPA
jgi:hypothetical protein